MFVLLHNEGKPYIIRMDEIVAIQPFLITETSRTKSNLFTDRRGEGYYKADETVYEIAVAMRNGLHCLPEEDNEGNRRGEKK